MDFMEIFRQQARTVERQPTLPPAPAAPPRKLQPTLPLASAALPRKLQPTLPPASVAPSRKLQPTLLPASAAPPRKLQPTLPLASAALPRKLQPTLPPASVAPSRKLQPTLLPASAAPPRKLQPTLPLASAALPRKLQPTLPPASVAPSRKLQPTLLPASAAPPRKLQPTLPLASAALPRKLQPTLPPASVAPSRKLQPTLLPASAAPPRKLQPTLPLASAALPRKLQPTLPPASVAPSRKLQPTLLPASAAPPRKLQPTLLPASAAPPRKRPRICNEPVSAPESVHADLPHSNGESVMRRHAPKPAPLSGPQTIAPSPPAAPSSSDGEDLEILEWKELVQLSDSDDEMADELADVVTDVDFANEAPANLPEDIDDDLVCFMTRQDDDADRLVRRLMTADNVTFDWTSDPDSFVGRREDFLGPSGPTFPVETTDRPIDLFMRYFDDEIFELLVTETNRNIAYLKTRTSQQHSLLMDTDRSEMGIFIAMLVLQGILPLPAEVDYFRENGYLTLKHFESLMSHGRFVVLKAVIELWNIDAHIDDTTDEDRKLRKLGPLLNLLNRRFSELYLPSRDIAIDESLLKRRSRLSFAQRIASKAAKVGIKTYELCESSSGYCWKMCLYTGKGHTHGQIDDGCLRAPTNSTAQIVLDLVWPLLNRGHTLVLDNFYNSPLLARYLKAHGTDCFGTLRINRQFVPEAMKGITETMLRPGEIMQSYCRDLSVTLWRDASVVALISTVHAGELGGREKYNCCKYKPQIVLDYDLSIGRVDKKDQLLSAFPMERWKSQAWYKKVFRRLLNVTILNAYIIYKTRHPQAAQRQFRTTLVNEIIATFKPPEVPRTIDDNNDREAIVIQNHGRKRPILTGNHFIGRGHSKYLKCVWCKKSYTAFKCKQCELSLCMRCFEEYHTN